VLNIVKAKFFSLVFFPFLKAMLFVFAASPVICKEKHVFIFTNPPKCSKSFRFEERQTLRLRQTEQPCLGPMSPWGFYLIHHLEVELNPTCETSLNSLAFSPPVL
jgi:hypothetical protein